MSNWWSLNFNKLILYDIQLITNSGYFNLSFHSSLGNSFSRILVLRQLDTKNSACSFDNFSMNSSLLGLVLLPNTSSRKSSNIFSFTDSNYSNFNVNKGSLEYSFISTRFSSGRARAMKVYLNIYAKNIDDSCKFFLKYSFSSLS